MTTAPHDLRSRLTGAIAFPITPFRTDLALDETGLRANLRVVLEHPPAAIVAAGGTGELYSLTPAEQLDVVRIAVEESAGRVPVIAGVGFNAASERRWRHRRRPRGLMACSCFRPTIRTRTRRAAGLLPANRVRHRPRRADLQPRLVSSWSCLRRAARGTPTLVGWKDGQGESAGCRS